MRTRHEPLPKDLRRALERVLEAAPGQVDLLDELHQAWRLLAWALREDDGPGAAWDDLEGILLFLPGRAWDWFLDLPPRLVHAGHVAEARRFAHAVARIWQPCDMLADLALALAEDRRRTDARIEIEYCLEHFPNVAWVQIKCAVAALALGDDAGAERRLRRALELSPSQPLALAETLRLFVPLLERTGRADDALPLRLELQDLDSQNRRREESLIATSRRCRFDDDDEPESEAGSAAEPAADPAESPRGRATHRVRDGAGARLYRRSPSGPGAAPCSPAHASLAPESSGRQRTRYGLY